MARFAVLALLIAIPAVLCVPGDKPKQKGRSLPPPPALGGVGTGSNVHLPGGVDASSVAGVGRYPPYPVPGVLPGYPGVGTGSNVQLPGGLNAGSIAGVGYPGYPIPGAPALPPYPGYGYPGVGSISNVNLPGGLSATGAAGVYPPRLY